MNEEEQIIEWFKPWYKKVADQLQNKTEIEWVKAILEEVKEDRIFFFAVLATDELKLEDYDKTAIVIKQYFQDQYDKLKGK